MIGAKVGMPQVALNSCQIYFKKFHKNIITNKPVIAVKEDQSLS
jgi:hypothetical protein